MAWQPCRMYTIDHNLAWKFACMCYMTWHGMALYWMCKTETPSIWRLAWLPIQKNVHGLIYPYWMCKWACPWHEIGYANGHGLASYLSTQMDMTFCMHLYMQMDITWQPMGSHDIWVHKWAWLGMQLHMQIGHKHGTLLTECANGHGLTSNGHDLAWNGQELTSYIYSMHIVTCDTKQTTTNILEMWLCLQNHENDGKPWKTRRMEM